MEIPAGLKSTQNYIVKDDLPKRERKKPPPVLDKRQRSARQQEIRVRLEQVSNERVKHDDALAKMVPERARLLQNLQSEKKRQEAKVASMLEEHFASASSGGLMDKVLQSEMIQPVLNQLQGNIDKLDHSIQWHRSKLQALSREEHQLDKEMDDLNCDDATEECYKAYVGWKDAWLTTEHLFDKFKQSILKARNLDREFAQRLPRLGESDHCFVLTVDSKLKNELIGEANMAVLVDELSKNYNLKHNWLYDPEKTVTRRLKAEEPLQRPTFDSGRKIGKIA